MALAIVRWVTSNAKYLSFAVFTMAQRVTLRKRNPYNTTSNRRRVVKTPGGKLVYHHIRKLPTAPKCGDCGIALPGVCVDIAIRFCMRVDKCFVHRFRPSDLASTRLSLRQRRPFVVRMVAQDVEIV